MPKTEIKSIDELRRQVGQDVAVSDWLTVTQERIDRFADATSDHQWIHVDRERAAQSPFGTTIAHGFLTLSLIPYFTNETFTFPPSRMTINYGLNRVRFTAPVRSGSRVRARFRLLGLEDVPGGVQMNWQITIELEGSEKPACVAETISRRYD
ncbi:MAG TPA: MaoC family dehydratase [Burkholderiales bacterium]